MSEAKSIAETTSTTQKNIQDIPKDKPVVEGENPSSLRQKPFEETLKRVKLLLEVGNSEPKMESVKTEGMTPDEIKETLDEMKNRSILSEEKIGQTDHEDVVLKRLTEINPKTPDEIQEMNNLIEQATSMTLDVKNAVDNIKHYYSSSRDILLAFKESKYATKKMTEQEAVDAIYVFRKNIHALSRDKLLLGKVLHRGEIGEQSKEMEELQTLIEDVSEVAYEHSTSSTKLHDLGNIEKLAGLISERTAGISVGKMYEYYNEKLDTEVNAEHKVLLSKESIGRICEADIQSSFINKIGTNDFGYGNKPVTDENIAEAVEIIRLAQRIPDKNVQSETISPDGIQPVNDLEIMQRIQKLPYELQYLQHAVNSYYYGADDYLDKLQNFINTYDAVKSKAKLIEEVKEFEILAKQATGNHFHKGKEWENVYSQMNKASTLLNNPKENQLSYVFDNYHMRFSLVKNFFEDPDIQNIFSPGQIEEYQDSIIDGFVSSTIKNELQHKANHFEPDDLFTLANPNTLPYQILFAFRRFTGQYPQDYYGSLHKYLQSITPEDYTRLTNNASDGIRNFLDLVKKGPEEKTLERKIYTHKNGELEETDSLPALSIEKAAIQVISEVLEHGTLEQQQYAIKCTLALQGKHEELNKILEKCLKSSEPAIRNYAIDQISILSEGMFPSTALLVLENYDVLKNNLENSTKNAFSKNVAKLFISGSPLALDNLDTVSELLDIPKESISKIQEIVAGYKEKFGHLPYVDSLGDFQQILHVSKNLELSELALDLFNRNVDSDLVFRNIDMLMQQKDKVLTEIDDIQLFVPDYKYIPVIGYKGRILMPYEELSDTDIKVFVKTFEEVHRINPVRTDIAASRLMDVLSETDPLLHGLPNAEHSQETRKLFLDSLLQISASANLPENDPRQAIGKLVDNKYMLHYLARQPEKAQEVINLPETQPEFFTLIQPGGPLHSNREIVLRDIFSNGRVERRAKEISSVFTKKVPYWKQLYMFTNTRIGDALANAQTYYPISEVSGVTWTSLTQQHKTVKAENPDKASRLEGIVSNPEVIRELVEGEIDTVPFHDISGIYKKVVFRDYLRRSIETSRSSTAKEFAGERNREKTSSTFKFKPEMYIHGSRLDIIDDVLSKGNLPQEALGERSGTDSFPFQVDFSRVTTDLLNSQGNSIKEVIDKTISKNYGDGVYYVYDRTDTDWEPGKVAYGYGEGHALMLGGVPSTEIGAILLNNPEIQFDITKNAILENGMYIPVYAFDGKLLFSPEEYDQKRQDLNLDVPVELWDYSLKTGEQKGSNPGAEFTIPTKTGPEKYYVKYVERDELDHLWSEQLADNLYRILDIPVPETKIVKINNSFGHASKLLPIDDTSERPGLKEGFIADSLLANWDAVYNQGNNIASGGETYRIDNGGALQFRARGQRKEDIFFSNVTREVEFGTDRQRLGLGMRQEYPDLTDEDIKTQTTILKEKLTDDEIEKQINSVRLPSSEREMLSKVLRERRDYIIDRFSSL